MYPTRSYMNVPTYQWMGSIVDLYVISLNGVVSKFCALKVRSLILRVDTVDTYTNVTHSPPVR